MSEEIEVSAFTEPVGPAGQGAGGRFAGVLPGPAAGADGRGAITSRDGATVTDPSARATAGLYRLVVPAALPPEPAAEDLGLSVLFEDDHLIVIDKPAGMAAHPAPGSQDRHPGQTP